MKDKSMFFFDIKQALLSHGCRPFGLCEVYVAHRVPCASRRSFHDDEQDGVEMNHT